MKDRNLAIEFVRVVILVILLTFTIVLQSVQDYFVNIELLFPALIALFISYFLHAIYVFSLHTKKQRKWLQWFFFFFDTTILSYLIYLTSIYQSFFLLLYFVHIALAGIVFSRRGAVTLASWVSILYSFNIILSGNEDVAFLLVLNNFSFFCTALLSSSLSEYMWSVGQELVQKKIDLKVARDLNEAIVKHVGGGIMSVDKTGKILQCNQEGLRIIAASEDRVLNQKVTDIFPLSVSFPLANDDHVNRDLRAEVQICNVEGEEIILDVITSPMLEEHQLVGFVILFQDITKVRKLEIAIRQSEKMVAVGQLAAGIAHEIRNPLASISGSIQLMDSLDVGSPDRERLKKISEKEIDRLNQLISEFLDFVKPEQKLKDVISASQLGEEVAEMIRLNKELSAEISFYTDIDAGLNIVGDSGKLKQALLNILINAFQALDGRTEPKVSFSIKEEQSLVIVAIADNGIGMDEANKNRIFEPFHTTKAKGTGLGLAVTHKILQMHRADIDIKSEKDIGTEFVLKFPKVEG